MSGAGQAAAEVQRGKEKEAYTSVELSDDSGEYDGHDESIELSNDSDEYDEYGELSDDDDCEECNEADDYHRYDDYEDSCAYTNSQRATPATDIRVLVASGVSDDEHPPTSMRMLNYRSLDSCNIRFFDDTIEIPTAQDTAEMYFDEAKRNKHVYRRGLLIGYIEVEDDKEPVWAAVSKHSSSYDVFFYKTDLFILRDVRQCTLLFPFSAIGFTATVGSISLLKSFIAVNFTAAMGIRFPHGGSSVVSVEAFRMAMKRVEEEVETQMNLRENHDIANGAFQDDDLGINSILELTYSYFF